MIGHFARHRTAANLLMVAIVVGGVLSLPELRRETFPDYRPREVQVRVPYPGAGPDDVEDGVLEVVEDALDGVRHIEEIRAVARENLGTVTVEMVEGADFRTFKDEIDTAVGTIDSLPERAEEPVVEELHTLDPVLTIVVAAELDGPGLERYAEGLKDRLRRDTDVGQVDIVGFSDPQLRVELDAGALARFGLAPSDVARAIGAQSVDLPAGTVETRGRHVLVRFDDERADPDALADLVVLDRGGGARVRVGDLGRVRRAFERDEERVVVHTADGGRRRAALLRVRKTEGQDVLRVAEGVEGFLDEERRAHPEVDLTVTQDFSILVRQRLALLVENGVQGIVLVFLAMWLFFSGRLAFWVALSLPISFLGAFFLMPWLDLTVNMLTLVGLLLGIGILMDDGIVIAENVAAHRERGKEPLRAAIDGVSEVRAGVVSSFLTTAAVLGPLMFLEGNIGRVLLVVPIVLLAVLSVSLVEAFLILPHHLAGALRHPPREGGPRARIERLFTGARDRLLGPSVDLLLRARYLWIGVVLLVFLGTLSIPARGALGFQGIPTLDGDVAVGRILMPQGTPLERTAEVSRRLVAGLREVDRDWREEFGREQSLVQVAYVRFDENQDAKERGTHVATVYADLLTSQERGISLDQVFERWRAATGSVPDAERINYTEPAQGPTGRSIEIRVGGEDLEELRGVALEIEDWIQPYPGVMNLTPDLRPGKPEALVRARPGALGLGLDARTMAAQLRAAFQGREALEIQVDGETVEVEARLDPRDQESITALTEFRFVRGDGERVPFAAVAETEERVGWSRIAHVDGRRTVSLLGDVDTRVGNTSAILSAFEQELLPRLSTEHPELVFEIEGESAETQKTARSLSRALLVGVIAVFLLLAFQFQSYVEPLIVMAAIPLALIGVIWGHLLLGFPLTMPSVLGFMALAGVVVNDSLLLVIFLRQGRAEGLDPVEAAGRASRLRFRAILITSVTTVIGLIPLTFETSLQAVVLIPLAISIVFGMLAATVLVLTVVPCLYVILDDLGLSATHAVEGAER